MCLTSIKVIITKGIMTAIPPRSGVGCFSRCLRSEILLQSLRLGGLPSIFAFLAMSPITGVRINDIATDIRKTGKKSRYGW